MVPPHENTTGQSSLHNTSTKIHIAVSKIKNSSEKTSFFYSNKVYLAAFPFSLKPSESFQQRQFYLWCLMIPEKKKSPAREKWEAQLGIFKAPQYISYFFSRQKFPFTKFLQLNLSSVSFSLFLFFSLKRTHTRDKSSFSLIHVFN